MKKNENKKTAQMQAIAICGCLCLLAVGAGVTYRAFDHRHLEDGAQMQTEQPVAALQTPTVEITALERNQQSKDDGEAPAPEEKAKQPEAKLTFAYPLEGEVVLPYSIDHAIYDPTLEQYRTNASISLAAEKGDAVQAAADGTVKEVTADGQSGTLVTLEHADGWLTTYGQLEDTVKVKQGETVKQGQTIGTVAEPTKYGVALGTHLEFAMAQDGQPKDPTAHLKEAK